MPGTVVSIGDRAANKVDLILAHVEFLTSGEDSYQTRVDRYEACSKEWVAVLWKGRTKRSNPRHQGGGKVSS